MRFFAAQANGLLEDDLWLANARHANAMAAQLAAATAGLPGVGLAYPIQTNGVFAEISRQLAIRLRKDWTFQVWSADADESCIVRWMTAFDTSAADVDRLAAAVEATAVFT